MTEENKGHPTTREAQAQQLLLELMKYRTAPTQAPKKLIDDIVALVDTSYKSLGLYGCGGEAFIIKVSSPLGDERCLKIVYPSEGIEGKRTITFWERTGLFGGMKTDYSVKSESISKIRFLASARVQRLVSNAIKEAKLSFFTVPEVYKVSENPLYLEMEWVPSIHLVKWLQEQHDLIKSLQCFYNLCQAIHFIHERGIIHRDIKPDNIYIWNNNGVCLLDWSVAKPIGDRNLTVTGMFIGSKMFMSPVQAEMAKASTHLDDIHCLGYVFFAVVMCKDLPLVLDNKIEYSKLLTKFRAQLVKELPEKTRSIFLKATEINEDARYQSAEEMAADVQKIIDDLMPKPCDIFTPQPSVVVKGTQNPLDDKTVASVCESPQSEPQKPQKIYDMGHFETLAFARYLSDQLIKNCTKKGLSQGFTDKCELETCNSCKMLNESLIILIVKILSTIKNWGYL